MNELDFKVLTEKRLLIVPDYTEGMMVTPIDQTLQAALKVELARNFGIWLKNDMGVTAEFVMDFFRWLKDRGKLMTQPYFPDLLPVNQAGVDAADLINNSGKIVSTTTRKFFMKKAMENRIPDSIELGWLEREMENNNGPIKILAGFLAKHLKGKKIKATRKERRKFMDRLEGVKDLYYYSLDMVDLWRKIALWIHPSDYDEYPRAQRFLFRVLEPEKKKEPEKPRLKKLMWKGWKEGKDFDVFESYIDQSGLTPRDLLISIRDYERSPRVSRWKKTAGLELGKEKEGQDESEIVDLMLLQLKEKLLGMIKPKKVNLKIPDSFYKIPAHSILKHPLVIVGGILPDEVCSFRITASKNVQLSTYFLDGSDSSGREWDLGGNINFFIVGYQMAGWNRTKLSITFAGKKRETIERSEIGVNEDVRSLILFGYESVSRTLKWIGEPSKTFYSGKPLGITDWKSVWKVVMKRKPILSLGEMAEKMYDNPETSTEDLTAERIRIDLGI